MTETSPDQLITIAISGIRNVRRRARLHARFSANSSRLFARLSARCEECDSEECDSLADFLAAGRPQAIDPEKLKRVLGLSEALDALVGMADLNSFRLPLQGKWEQQSLLAWNDPDCLTTIPDVSPVLIKKVALPNIDQAWYLESFEGTGAVELPVTRRVFLRQGSRWVVVSEVKSAQQELGSDAEAMLDRLETTCKPSRDERPDVVACATQIWFGEYRKPEVADQWMREMLTRLQW